MGYPVQGRVEPASLPGFQKTVGELVDAFLRNAEKTNRSPGKLRTYKTPARVLREFYGESRTLVTVRTEDIAALLDFLETFPKNARQRYPGKTVLEAAKAAAKMENVERLSRKAMRSTHLTISTIFSHGKNLGWMESNPAISKLLTARFKERRKQPKKEQFSVEELNRLFRTLLYAGCQNDRVGYNRPGPNRQRRGRFWVPLLALFHGMRLNECCQLVVSDIALENGVDVTRITLGDSEEENAHKRLKTGASERKFRSIQSLCGSDSLSL